MSTPEEIPASGDSPTRGFGSRTGLGKARFAGFVLVALIALGLAAVMLRDPLALAATLWFADAHLHTVHDLIIFSMLWIAFVFPMALSLYRSTDRVTTALAPALFFLPIAAMAILEGNEEITMLGGLFGGLSLLALVLHPAGRGVLRFDRAGAVPRGLVGLWLVGAVPLLVFATDQVLAQFALVDEHVQLIHYGAVATTSVLIVVMAALAVFRRRDWRAAAWIAGLSALVIGTASVAFPDIESSLGVIGGALLVAWAVTFVVGVEYSRREAESVDTANGRHREEPA